MAYTKDNFPYDEYLKANPDLVGGSKVDQNEYDRAWAKYQKDGSNWTSDKDAPALPTPDVNPGVNVVAGKPDSKDQINVADYASQVATNPGKAFTDAMTATDQLNDKDQVITNKDVKKGEIDGDAKELQMGKDPTVQADQVKQQTDGSDALDTNLDGTNVKSQDVKTPTQPKTETYNAATTEDKVKNNQMTAAQGTVSDKAQIKEGDVPQADIKGLATGVNEDGTTNYTGQALQQFASVNLSNVIDTSTSAGKLLAEQLGEGNYVDAKATLKGQLDILQSEFTDPATGLPKIPMWAASTARNVSKIAAFKGMSGTAATAAMATALMEASIPIAQQDANFFQTLTIKNLDNKQQATINAANVLAKFEQQNLDNRMTAAVHNAQAFLAMDMKNLDNEQQARVINNQARIQSILEDAKAQNTARMFAAEQKNQMNLSYDQLAAQIQAQNADRNLTAQQLNQQTQLAYDKLNSENAQFNAEQERFYDQLNTQIAQFNSSQNLDADKFNANMEDSREKFYKEMQYNIAVSNAKWRQTVQLQEDTQAHEAMTLDVKNMVDLSVNQLNQLWDRSDSLLDYVWKSSENDKDRKTQLATVKLQTRSNTKGETASAVGSLVGTFLASDSGSKVIDKVLNIF